MVFAGYGDDGGFARFTAVRNARLGPLKKQVMRVVETLSLKWMLPHDAARVATDFINDHSESDEQVNFEDVAFILAHLRGEH